MAVGEIITTKWIWLLDEVEIVGIVHNIEEDEFDIQPEPNYFHLISNMRGNMPLPWLGVNSPLPGLLHCETYVLDPSRINRADPWRLPTKPGDQPFRVKLPAGGDRDIAQGDRVRVVGRWVIDHHPEYCDPTKLSIPVSPDHAFRCRTLGPLGELRVGMCHAELHPFAWDDIRLVEDAPPTGTRSLTLSLAAPIYEEQYIGNWKWAANEVEGVAGKVFIAHDLSNYHETVSANVRIFAPGLPATGRLGAKWSEVWRELTYSETVLRIGVGLTPDQVRSIAVQDDGSIYVSASITATSLYPGGRASIHDPASDRSIFQARYDVAWKFVGAQISCTNKTRIRYNREIEAVGGALPDGTRWRLTLGKAINLIEQGHSFYVEPLEGRRVAVQIARNRLGQAYLKTVTDIYQPTSLLALPDCSI